MWETKDFVKIWKQDIVTSAIMIPRKYEQEFLDRLEKFNSEIREDPNNVYHIGCEVKKYNFIREDFSTIELTYVESDRVKAFAFLANFCKFRNLQLKN